MAHPETDSVDLLSVVSETIFGSAARPMWQLGWSVFPQERGRMPSKIEGRCIKPVSDHHVDERLVDEFTFTRWEGFCACENVAVIPGPATANIFAVDIDVLDEKLAAEVIECARHHLGDTPFLRVGKAPKAAMFYRHAADDVVRSTSRRFADEDGKDSGNAIEILGRGKTITLFGRHHGTGSHYTWPSDGDGLGGSTPLLNPPTDAPEVASEQVAAFMEAVEAIRPFVKASSFDTAKWNVTASGEVAVARIERDSDELIVDGREEYLSSLVFRTVRMHGEQLLASSDDERQDLKADITGALIAEFKANAKVGDGRWAAGALAGQVRSRVDHLVNKIINGYVKPAARKNRKAIQVAVGGIKEQVDAAEQALLDSGLLRFHRGGSIVHLVEDAVITADGVKVPTMKICERGEAGLFEDLSVVADWERFDGRSEAWKPTDVPKQVISVLRDRGRWRLPYLTGIISAPTIRADGSLLDKPGYDESTGLLFDPQGVEFPAIPASPTKADAAAALNDLKTLVSTFPFVDPVDRAVALSVFLTATVRRTLSAAPGFGFTAPTAGTGKSKLAEIAGVIQTGRRPGVTSQGDDEAESEKRFGAALMSGDPYIFLDNCDLPVGGKMLNALFTAETVKARILGKSEQPELPTTVLFMATGNNLVIDGDMTRRIPLCRLDAGVERPECRVFECDPVDVAQRRRPALVAACLTIMRAYHIAAESDKKSAPDPVGSFEAWCRRIRDALVWLGEADAMASLEEARLLDPRLGTLQYVLSQWHQVIGGDRITASDLKRAAEVRAHVGDVQDNGRYQLGALVNPDLHEALCLAAGTGGMINSRRLGIWLGQNARRICHGMAIIREAEVHGVSTWRLSY